MYDTGKIVAGLVIFLGLVTFPVWYNIPGEAATRSPELKIGTEETECVAPTEYMTVSHMDLLSDWRDQVVREGKRVYVGFNGRRHEMSLTGTCLGCHSDRAEFCDKCHEYVGVRPYCWDCHNEPEESN